VRRTVLDEPLREFFERAPPDARAVHLDGRERRGTATASSDIDLVVRCACPPRRTLDAQPLEMEVEFECRLGRPVQVIVLRDAPAELVHQIPRDGRLLLDRDRAARIRFEVPARNEFVDLSP
jgi:predicted nucleotidyltransferase